MKKHIYFFVLVVVLVSVAIVVHKHQKRYIFNEGFIHGTIYHIVYDEPEGNDLKSMIEKVMQGLDNTASTFKENSIISRINRNDSTVEVDHRFAVLFEKSQEISRITGGAFDITVGPLVDLWGFGTQKRHEVDSLELDSVRQLIGYQKVWLEGKKLMKKDSAIELNMNAIAKGYTVDLVADFFDSRGIKNYMIEIGGEVRAKGSNKEGRIWRIGIDKPIDDVSASSQEVQDVISLTDMAVATSGNYRNFYVKDGRKYAHTIDPVSGYPVQHEVLGVSVLANDCMTADAFATSFMVLGLKKSVEIIDKTPGLDAYFIYNDDKGQNKVYCTEGLKALIVER